MRMVSELLEEACRIKAKSESTAVGEVGPDNR